MFVVLQKLVLVIRLFDLLGKPTIAVTIKLQKLESSVMRNHNLEF